MTSAVNPGCIKSGSADNADPGIRSVTTAKNPKRSSDLLIQKGTGYDCSGHS